VNKNLTRATMSAFSTQADFAKPGNKSEFATDREVAARLGAQSERTVRRYKCDSRAREILGVVPYGRQLRVPKQQDWSRIARELESLGKAPRVPPARIFKREMGMGDRRRERDAEILRRALDLERLYKKRRLTPKLKYQIEQLWKLARRISGKHHCSVFAAPKFVRRFLEAANEKARKHNEPQIEWLKCRGLWSKAKKYCENGQSPKFYFGEGEAHFDVVETFRCKGRNVSIPHRISLYAVKTKAQIAREVVQFNQLWPSQKRIDQAIAKRKEIWWQIDLEGACARLRKEGKKTTVKNRCSVLHLNEVAEWQNRPGISRSSYFRRYSKADRMRFRRSKTAEEYVLPSKKRGGSPDSLPFDDTDLDGMTIQKADGWELPNPYRTNR
jgi:hypothetical protein